MNPANAIPTAIYPGILFWTRVNNYLGEIRGTREPGYFASVILSYDVKYVYSSAYIHWQGFCKRACG